MGLGVYNNTGLGVAEKTVGTTSQVILSVPTSYGKAQGQMDFIKLTTGDTIYIGLCGKKATPTNYDIILTDAIPFFDIDGLALGDVWAVGTAATSRLTANILACT